MHRSLGPSVLADDILNELKALYEDLCTDQATIRAVTFLVAFPVASRSPWPEESMLVDFGCRWQGGVLQTLDVALQDGPAKAALQKTVHDFTNRSSSDRLFEVDEWAIWREADGPPFCDLAKLFFGYLNEEHFSAALGGTTPEISRFAHEAAIITRSFSARWFNACARYQIPEQGSINWYLGHCLGKIDLELSRELSDWLEPTGNPWKRRKAQTQTALKV